jgi:hypothetical protein
MKLLKALTIVLLILTIQSCSKPDDVSEKIVKKEASISTIRRFESTTVIDRGGFIGYNETPKAGITLLFDQVNQTVTIDNSIDFHPFQTFNSGTYPCVFTAYGNLNIGVQFSNLSSFTFSNTDGIYMDFRVLDLHNQNGSEVSESIIFKEIIV